MAPVDLVQHAVDAEPRNPDLAPRLEMDVAGALVERILKQPVDDVDHMRVVGLDLAASSTNCSKLDTSGAAPPARAAPFTCCASL